MWIHKRVIWAVVVVTGVVFVQGVVADKEIPMRQVVPHKGQIQSQPATPGPDCPDPIALRIEVKKLAETGPRSARVQVTGIVQNRGRQHWEPSNYSDRLRFILAEGADSTDILLSRFVTDLKIRRLDAGVYETFSYERNWNADSHPDGFMLRFHGGPQDCDHNNNRKYLSAAEVNWNLGYTGPPDRVKLPDRFLRVSGYKIVGQGRVEVKLAFIKKTSRESIRISTKVAEPYEGQAEPVYVSGTPADATKSGVVTANVQINCRIPSEAPPEVTVNYSLDTYVFGTIYQSGVVKASHTLLHRDVCLQRSQGAGAATQVQ